MGVNEVYQGVMLQQLCFAFQCMQHDMQELKGSVEWVSQEVKRQAAIQQQLVDTQEKSIAEKMDVQQDSIVKKLRRDMAQNHREVMDKHVEQCELVEVLRQQRFEHQELQLQALGDEVQERPILPEVKSAPSWLEVAVKSWTKPGLMRTCTKSILEEVDVRMTTKELVINFRRLNTVDRFFELVHELIKSTAIAALTLVAAHTPRQGAFSVLFIVLVFLLYVRHDKMYDCTDIEDVKKLMPLVCNDDHKCKRDQTNPNGLLKSLSLHHRGWYLWGWGLVLFTVGLATILGWFCLICWRGLIDVGADVADLHHLDPHERLGFQIVGDEDDAGNLAMQLIILDIMLFIELVFEYILWREMFMVMPAAPAGSTVWDPRVHGVPRSWLLGLPSMWITSQEALKSLKQYAVWAQLGSDKNAEDYVLSPAELARYALLGESNRCELSKTLRESKLFDARKQQFVDKHGNAINHVGDAETLGIAVCFFECLGYHFPNEHALSVFKYPGQVQKWVEAVAEEEDAVCFDC